MTELRSADTPPPPPPPDPGDAGRPIEDVDNGEPSVHTPEDYDPIGDLDPTNDDPTDADAKSGTTERDSIPAVDPAPDTRTKDAGPDNHQPANVPGRDEYLDSSDQPNAARPGETRGPDEAESGDDAGLSAGPSESAGEAFPAKDTESTAEAEPSIDGAAETQSASKGEQANLEEAQLEDPSAESGGQPIDTAERAGRVELPSDTDGDRLIEQTGQTAPEATTEDYDPLNELENHEPDSTSGDRQAESTGIDPFADLALDTAPGEVAGSGESTIQGEARAPDYSPDTAEEDGLASGPDDPSVTTPAADFGRVSPSESGDHTLAATAAPPSDVVADSATPRADAMRDKRPERIPEASWDRICDGVAFNEERGPYYADQGGGNEITLEGGKRLDSYVPAEEIVSRKHTQLASIREETAVGYIRELDRKYSPGEIVADTPHNRRELPNQVGKKIGGLPILEVPVQNDPVPEAVLIAADERGITIRDTNGKLYELP